MTTTLQHKIEKEKTLHGLPNKMTQMSLWVDGMSILGKVPSQKQLITETAVGLLEELVDNIGNFNGNNCGKFQGVLFEIVFLL